MMQVRKTVPHFILASFTGAALCSCAAGGGIDAYNNPTLYPAKVQSMVFDGNTLDATHTVNWGNWTVSFPFGQMPVAKYFQANGQPGSISSTYISGLSCSNSISGSQSCSITINYGIPNVGVVCGLLGPPPNFQINCPDSLVFAQ